MKSIQQTCRLILAGAIAFGFNYLFQWHESYWIIITALLGVQFCPQVLWRDSIIILLCSGFIAALLAVLCCVLFSNVFCLAVFIMLVTGLSIYLGVRYAVIRGMAFIINFIVTLSAGILVSQPFVTQRFLCVLLGFGVAAFLQLVFFPSRSGVLAKTSLIDCFGRLSQLNRAIFSCFISRDYPQKHYLYDKELHKKRADFLFAITKAREAGLKLRNGQFSLILDQVENLYEMILSLGILLHRVGDHTTFEVASVEFTALAVSIADCFQMLEDKIQYPHSPTRMDESFTEAIFQLEEINRSALQVVAREPIVFMFFINDLNELKDTLLAVAADIENWLGSKTQ
jgi:hypothetical protein